MSSQQISRRTFLNVCAATTVVALFGQSHSRERGRQRIGLALGAGGARGLAHIPILEVFDELGIKPHRLAGTSMGAVIGVLYASGLSGHQIRELIDGLIVRESESFTEALRKGEIFKLAGFLDLAFGNGGLLSAEKFVAFVQEVIQRSRFEKLDIPLKK